MATPSHDKKGGGSPRSLQYPPQKEAPPGVYTRYIKDTKPNTHSSIMSMKNKDNNYHTGNKPNKNTARSPHKKIQT